MNTPALTHPARAAVAATLLLLATSAVHAEVEDKITKSFPVEPGGQLEVAVDRGSIEIKTTDASVVNLEVTRKAGGSQSKAEKTLKDHVVTATQDGNRVQVRAEFQGAKTSGWFGRSPELQVSYVLTIPHQFDADLKTAGGHIKVAGLAGRLVANTSGGHLDLRQIEGLVTARTQGGNVTLAGCKGNVELGTSGGNMTLSDVQGDLTAKTSGGSIRASNLAGKATVKTSGGHIQLTKVTGSVCAETSGGHVTAELLEQPADKCSFETSGGNVTLKLAGAVAVDVDAHTSAGRVSTELPVVSVVQGEQKRYELRGKINGGGPLITLRTSGGNVKLEKE